MDKLIKIVVHQWPTSEWIGSIEAQSIYEQWLSQEEGTWLKNNAIGDLEVKQTDTTYGIDMGGGYPISHNYEVTATLTEKNYVFYKLKWAR